MKKAEQLTVVLDVWQRGLSNHPDFSLSKQAKRMAAKLVAQSFQGTTENTFHRDMGWLSWKDKSSFKLDFDNGTVGNEDQFSVFSLEELLRD
ncbi:MAG: hypothetical protein Q8Q05_01365 [bacterium]|nr:hypothetical protein [bacterium]